MELRRHRLGDLKMCQTLIQVCAASKFSQSIANLAADSLIKQRISHCHIRSHHQTALEATSVLVQTTISSQDLLGMGQDKPTIDSLTPSLSGPHQPWITGVLHQDLGVLPKTRKNETTEINGGIQRLSFQTSQDWSFQTGPCFGLPIAKRVEGAVVLWCCLF